MKMKNEITGQVLEVPPPDELGHSVILLDGKVIESVLYSDESNSVTLGNGIVFRSPGGFAKYVVELLHDSAAVPQQGQGEKL